MSKNFQQMSNTSAGAVGARSVKAEHDRNKRKRRKKIAADVDEFELGTNPGGRSLREGDRRGSILGGRPGGVGSVLGG